jgi:hypothetical protein
MSNPYSQLLAGRWIGETQGYDMPAHIWEISVKGDRLTIQTRWENETKTEPLGAVMIAEEPRFKIGSFIGSLIGTQHFIIPNWDTNDTRGKIGPNYDVVFSRPGLAELQAFDVWQKFRQEAAKAES